MATTTRTRRRLAGEDFATAPLPRAPWVEELTTDVARELQLDDFAELAAEPAAQGAVIDVAVIGCGVAGLSAALAAARHGARVLALEAAERIGCGATGRNAGILSAGINMGLAEVDPGDPNAAMWPATTEVLLELVAEAQEAGALLSASLTGSLSLAERTTAARQLEREARVRVANGLRAEVWAPAHVAEATSGRLNTSRLVAALWLPDEGRINSLTLLAHLAHQARAAGVALAGSARVQSWETGRGRAGDVWRFQLAAGGTISARALVLALGPTHEPTARISAAAFTLDLPETFPLFWDSSPYTYCDFRPAKGRLVSSGGRYGRPGAVLRDPIYYRRLTEAARHWLPELACAQPTHAWSVDLAVAHDMVPHLRDLGAPLPGVAIEGLGALGILPGIVLGRRAGDELARRSSR
jgi:glycine/D-amino acid oxidase-like deaminating enzyme